MLKGRALNLGQEIISSSQMITDKQIEEQTNTQGPRGDPARDWSPKRWVT